MSAEKLAPLRTRNGRLCLVLVMLWAMFFGSSIMTTYYKLKGFETAQIFILQSTLVAAGILGNVPNGYLADRYGIKNLILVGTVGFFIESALFSQCDSFWQFEVVICLAGYVGSVLSGTTSTLIRAESGSAVCQDYEWWAVQSRLVGYAGGIVLGDVLIRHGGMAMPYVAQPIVYLVATIVALYLIHQDTPTPKGRPRHVMWDVVKKMLGTRKDIRWFLIFFSVMNSVSYSLFWLMQLQLKDVGLPVTSFGAFYLIKSAISVAMSWSTRFLWRWKSSTARYFLFATTCSGAFIGAVVGGWIGVVATVTTQSFASVCIIQMINAGIRKMLPDDSPTHTTELSVASAVAALAFAILGPIFGAVADATHSTRAAHFCVSLTGFALGVWSLVMLRREPR